MSISEHTTWDEALIWSDMAATFYRLTGRDPNDDESLAMVHAARSLAAEKRFGASRGLHR